jgi:hypothetical protein
MTKLPFLVWSQPHLYRTMTRHVAMVLSRLQVARMHVHHRGIELWCQSATPASARHNGGVRWTDVKAASLRPIFSKEMRK